MYKKRSEVYSPDDLCWIQVKYEPPTGVVTIRDSNDPENGSYITICKDSYNQLTELIEILQHIRNIYSISGVRNDEI